MGQGGRRGRRFGVVRGGGRGGGGGQGRKVRRMERMRRGVRTWGGEDGGQGMKEAERGQDKEDRRGLGREEGVW